MAHPSASLVSALLALGQFALALRRCRGAASGLRRRASRSMSLSGAKPQSTPVRGGPGTWTRTLGRAGRHPAACCQMLKLGAAALPGGAGDRGLDGERAAPRNFGTMTMALPLPASLHATRCALPPLLAEEGPFPVGRRGARWQVRLLSTCSPGRATAKRLPLGRPFELVTSGIIFQGPIPRARRPTPRVHAAIYAARHAGVERLHEVSGNRLPCPSVETS